ncbi:MAG: hypothetical protein EVA34_04195 [Erythrobacter sp.]|nr:MAG: hypothetical protein EVA34_04195 [Erythrobacter sp.]
MLAASWQWIASPFGSRAADGVQVACQCSADMKKRPQASEHEGELEGEIKEQPSVWLQVVGFVE